MRQSWAKNAQSLSCRCHIRHLLRLWPCNCVFAGLPIFQGVAITKGKKLSANCQVRSRCRANASGGRQKSRDGKCEKGGKGGRGNVVELCSCQFNENFCCVALSGLATCNGLWHLQRATAATVMAMAMAMALATGVG